MSQVQQLLESAAGSWKNLQSDAAKLAGKWSKTGLLEGLEYELANHYTQNSQSNGHPQPSPLKKPSPCQPWRFFRRRFLRNLPLFQRIHPVFEFTLYADQFT